MCRIRYSICVPVRSLHNDLQRKNNSCEKKEPLFARDPCNGVQAAKLVMAWLCGLNGPRNQQNRGLLVCFSIHMSAKNGSSFSRVFFGCRRAKTETVPCRWCNTFLTNFVCMSRYKNYHISRSLCELGPFVLSHAWLECLTFTNETHAHRHSMVGSKAL